MSRSAYISLLILTVFISINLNAQTFKLETVLNDAFKKSGAPGMGVMTTSSDTVLELYVAGKRRVDRADKIATDDPFHIGSVSKTFTATLIAKLVEEKKIKWSSTVSSILPQVTASGHEAYKNATIADLLAHEVGLKPMEEMHEIKEVPLLKGDVTAQRYQFSQWVFQQTPSGKPFKEYRYSNAHFIVAAAMAEKITGKPWELLIEQYIFEPLNMTNSGFSWPGKDDTSVPWGHELQDGSFQPMDPNGSFFLPPYFGPAGDIHASLNDMAKYFQAYLKSWKGNNGYLQKSTIEKMLTAKIRSGLGWGVKGPGNFKHLGMYAGSAGTFEMLVIMILDIDLAITVVSNSASESSSSALKTIVRGLLKHNMEKLQQKPEK